MDMLPKYYVYEWVRPDYDVVFYVGKGTRNRAFNFKRNKHTNDVISFLNKKGLQPQVRILERFINEDSAFDYEIERIGFWSPLGELTNDLPGGRNGGGGMTGKKHKKETIKKMRLSQAGRVFSLETRKKLRQANLGKTVSLETRAKMSESQKGRKHSEKTKIKIANGIREAKKNPERKERASKSAKESQNRLDVKLKKSLSIRAAKRLNPKHWTQKLSQSEIWEIGTLLTSKKDISIKYGISEVGVIEIRKIVEEKLGIGPRKNIGAMGKKVKPETVEKYKIARIKKWKSLTKEEKTKIANRAWETRRRNKLLKQLVV